MKDSKSSLMLYILYKYSFGFMILIMALGTTKGHVQDGTPVEYTDIGLLRTLAILGTIFLLLQILALRLVVRATVNKEAIRFNNGQTVKWDNVKFINRLNLLYVLKTKDKNRYYLFPTERQPIGLFGDRIKYTDMEQIINLKRTD
jgi:hypothetical protein